MKNDREYRVFENKIISNVRQFVLKNEQHDIVSVNANIADICIKNRTQSFYFLFI